MGEQLFFMNIEKPELLKPEQEVELAKLIEAGLFAQEKLDNMTAAEKNSNSQLVVDLQQLSYEGAMANNYFFEANQLLVTKNAHRYIGLGVDFADLVQEGRMGLMKAIQKFDYTRGTKFSTTATIIIRGVMTTTITNQSRTVRVAEHMVQNLVKLEKARRELAARLEHTPTTEELAAELGLPLEKIIKWQKYARPMASLDFLLGEDGDTFGDIIIDTDINVSRQVANSTEKEWLRAQIEVALTRLSSRDAQIIRLRFGFDNGDPKTLEEIGKEYGLTKERIRQIVDSSLQILKNSEIAEVFAIYEGES